MYIPQIKETLAEVDGTLLSGWLTFLAQKDDSEVHLDEGADEAIKLAYSVALDRSQEVMQMYEYD